MHKSQHILNAASNLLGITLVIIAGLHIANVSARTLADEVAWVSAVCLSLSCVTSYLSIRAEGVREGKGERMERFADLAFMAGLFSLIASVVVLAVTSRG